MESAPGLGKTLIARTLSEVLELDHKRIQFTPDLMPSDIIGTTIVSETEDGKRYFDFQRGPVFTNILLADEITRATPKTQSALLEAMQERMVSVGGTSYELDRPYFVIATMSQEEDSEGTYHLPEAQLDRFFFKLNLPKPDGKQEEFQTADGKTGFRGAAASVQIRGKSVTKTLGSPGEIRIGEKIFR